MFRHTYALAPGEGLEAALARFTPAQLAYMREHNLIRVLERPAAEAVDVQHAANALAAWRQHAQSRRKSRRQRPVPPRFAPMWTPEDRAQARRLLRQYRVARCMHRRLQQRRVHVLFHCFCVLRAPCARLAAARHAHLAGRAQRVLRRYRLAVRVCKLVRRRLVRALWGPFCALNTLRRMAQWVPRLLLVWRQWLLGCARQRRANMLVAAAGSAVFRRRHGYAWALPARAAARRAPCASCGQ